VAGREFDIPWPGDYEEVRGKRMYNNLKEIRRDLSVRVLAVAAVLKSAWD